MSEEDEEGEDLWDIEDKPLEGEECFNKKISLENLEMCKREAKRMGLCLVNQDEVDMYYMFINVVGLLSWQARLLVCQHGYGIGSRDCLAGYHFTKSSSSTLEAQLNNWGRPWTIKGKAYSIRLQPAQIENLRLVAYACYAAKRISCRPEEFDVSMLRWQHLDGLKTKMLWERDHRISDADIPPDPLQG